MKKQNKTETETKIAAEVIAQQIAQNVPNTPSVRAIMYRITAIVTQAGRTVKAGHNPANVYAAALSAIHDATRNYWKHHARA